MRIPFLRFWKTLVRLEEFRAVFLWLLPPSGGVLAMVSAYADDLPWHQIMFWGSGVFAFLMVGISYAWKWRQSLTALEKIRLSSVGIAQLGKDEKGEKISIATQYIFHNHADIPIYVSLKRASISIDGRVNPKASVDSSVSLVQSNSDHIVTGATVPDISKKEVLAGAVEFTIHYGSKKDNLRYLMDYEGELSIHIVDDPNNPRAAHASATARHKKVEHSVRIDS